VDWGLQRGFYVAWKENSPLFLGLLISKLIVLFIKKSNIYWEETLHVNKTCLDISNQNGKASPLSFKRALKQAGSKQQNYKKSEWFHHLMNWTHLPLDSIVCTLSKQGEYIMWSKSKRNKMSKIIFWRRDC